MIDFHLMSSNGVQKPAFYAFTSHTFVLFTVPCTDSNCKLCNTGPDLCSVCEVGSAFNEARTECVGEWASCLFM